MNVILMQCIDETVRVSEEIATKTHNLRPVLTLASPRNMSCLTFATLHVNSHLMVKFYLKYVSTNHFLILLTDVSNRVPVYYTKEGFVTLAPPWSRNVPSLGKYYWLMSIALNVHIRGMWFAY